MKLQRSDIKELHCIVPLVNVPSIVTYGILSHERAQEVHHHSVASPEVQSRRARTMVRNGLPLHQYANLYFDARNPMMYRVTREHDHTSLCVLRVSTNILDLPGVVIADRNAAADMVRFGPSPEGLGMIDRDLVFAEWWNGSDEAKKVRCAEVLVPHRVDQEFITGAYVSCEDALIYFNALDLTGCRIQAIIYEHLFYR